MTFTVIINDIITYAPYVITGASALAAAFPKAQAGSYIAMAQGFIDFLALNFGHAKTTTPPSA